MKRPTFVPAYIMPTRICRGVRAALRLPPLPVLAILVRAPDGHA